MKKFVSIIFIIFVLTSCTAKQVPVIPESTSTLMPTSIPTIGTPSATLETIVPTNALTNTPIVDTSLAKSNQRFSPVDGMPQVLIPEGKFRMGGMDARSAPEERPAHYVTLHRFWMDQLEVTNAMYLLCVKSVKCTPPQSFKSLRRTDYFQQP